MTGDGRSRNDGPGWREGMMGRTLRRLVTLPLLAVAACSESNSAPPPVERPVRTVTVERRAVSEPIFMTGHIRPREEVNLAFRTDGKLLERRVAVGDEVKAGQVVARIESQNEVNALRSAEADLAAAQASLTQAQRAEGRQRELLTKGFTTRTQYDQAQQQFQTAQAQVDSAGARLRSAQDRLSYTELRADATGIVIARGAEPGEVVRAGQMIVQLARGGEKDAVFNVPAQLMMLRGVPTNPVVEIAMTDNPEIKTTGTAREIATQADAATRTFPVKIALNDPPAEMRLGATVTGGIVLTSPPVIEIPATAVTRLEGKPAVWVVDPDSKTVDLRTIQVLRVEPSSVIVGDGLRDGELVVTAGVHVLRPGQKVKLLGSSS
jgi:RND family efflux transporter MFP subunit